MRLQKISRDSGVVLIIVIMIIFLMSIVCATIFSQSMSQTKTARIQVDNIVAEELAKGLFWKNHQENYPSGLLNAGATGPGSCTDSPCVDRLNNRDFTSTVSFPTSPNTNVSVTVNY